MHNLWYKVLLAGMCQSLLNIKSLVHRLYRSSLCHSGISICTSINDKWVFSSFIHSNWIEAQFNWFSPSVALSLDHVRQKVVWFNAHRGIMASATKTTDSNFLQIIVVLINLWAMPLTARTDVNFLNHNEISTNQWNISFGHSACEAISIGRQNRKTVLVFGARSRTPATHTCVEECIEFNYKCELLIFFRFLVVGQ